MKKSLTIENFSEALEKELGKRFIPANADSRKREAELTLREIIGEDKWLMGILDPVDLATLYHVINGRKARISAVDDRDRHDAQRCLAEAVELAVTNHLGINEYEFQDLKVDNALVNSVLETPTPTAGQATDYSALANNYQGTGNENALLDPELVQPPSPLAAARLGPRGRGAVKKPEKNLISAPNPKFFNNAWQALQDHCTNMNDPEVGADAITGFIAGGANAAINLKPEAFARKVKTARSALSWNQIDSKEAQGLLDRLTRTYDKFNEKRELDSVVIRL